MIASLLALSLAPVLQDAPVLQPIGRQSLPAQGCAAYLWNGGPKRQLVAMATAEPGQLRLKLDGRVVDVARAGGQGAAGYGFAEKIEYRGPDVTAVLDLTVQTRPDLAGGAVVPAATLRVERPGRDVLVAPVAGLIGCV